MARFFGQIYVFDTGFARVTGLCRAVFYRLMIHVHRLVSTCL